MGKLNRIPTLQVSGLKTKACISPESYSASPRRSLQITFLKRSKKSQVNANFLMVVCSNIANWQVIGMPWNILKPPVVRSKASPPQWLYDSSPPNNPTWNYHGTTKYQIMFHPVFRFQTVIHQARVRTCVVCLGHRGSHAEEGTQHGAAGRGESFNGCVWR